ncbi:hypothetical protein MMPV_008732 [Pyropia vietnamensis]
MPRQPLPPIPGALRALAPLSPAQRRWLLATDGAVEAGLTPAGLTAAATWAHTEAVSIETLAALMPDAVAVTPPADVPGSALTVDIAHLFVPYASVNGITIGLVTTTVRFWVYQHTPDGPAAVPTGGPHTASSSGRYASPLPTAPCSIDLGRFLYDESTEELYYRVRLAGALSIKRVSPNLERGHGGRTRTFSLFEPSPAAAAEGVPGVSVSHLVLQDSPLLSRAPGGRLRVGGGSGQGVYGDWRNRPLTSVIDFSGFATALGRMAGLFGVSIRGALSGIDVGLMADEGRRDGPFPIHTCDTISPLEEVWGAPHPRGGTGFGGDQLASVVAVVAAAAATSATKPPSAASSVVVVAKSKFSAETAQQAGLASPSAAGAATVAEKRPTAEETPPPKSKSMNRHYSRRRRERAAARRRRAAAAARPPGAVEDTSGVIGDEPAEVQPTITAVPVAVATTDAVASAAFADGDAASESDDDHVGRNWGTRTRGNSGVAASSAVARDAGGSDVGPAGVEEAGPDLSARHVQAFADLFEGSDEWVPPPR